jgi:hypothetical protein
MIETVDLRVSRGVDYSGYWPPCRNPSLLSRRRKKDAKEKSYLLSDSFGEKMKDHRKEHA